MGGTGLGPNEIVTVAVPIFVKFVLAKQLSVKTP